MSFIDKFKGKSGRSDKPNKTPVNLNDQDKFAYNYLMQKLDEVESETQSEYSQKYTLKRFIEGDQWNDTIRASRTQPVTDNMCAPVVEKYVSFFTRTIPKDKITTKPSFETLVSSNTPTIDEEEVERGFEKEQHENDLRLELLKVVKQEDNNYEQEVTNAAFNSIGLRDGFMRVVGDEKSGKIKLTSLNPFQSRIFWKSDDYTKMDGYCHVSMRSIHSIAEEFGVVVGEEEYDLQMETKKTYIGMSRFYDAWFNGKEFDPDDEEKPYYLWNVTMCGGNILRNKKYYFAQEIEAVVHLPSIKRTNEPFGRSLIEDIVDAEIDPDNSLQMQRNKIWSDLTDLARYAPNNILLGIGTNVGDKDLPTGSEPYLIELGRDQDIRPLQLAKPMLDFERLLRDNLQAIDDKTGMPRAAFGDLSSIDLATGIGLTTAFESATSKLQLVAKNWKPALERLNKYIFMWTEYLYPEAATIIQGNYKTEVKFGKMQPRDLALYSTVIINQKNAHLISGETAMQELDIVESPRQEQIKVANEENNEWLNPELALQKIQTRAQVQAVEAKLKEQEARPQAGARPSPLGGGGGPAMPAGENQSGIPQPMSQQDEAGGRGQVAGPPNELTGKQ